MKNISVSLKNIVNYFCLAIILVSIPLLFNGCSFLGMGKEESEITISEGENFMLINDETRIVEISTTSGGIMLATSQDESIVKVSIDKNKLTMKALNEGETTITVGAGADKKHAKPKNKIINIKVFVPEDSINVVNAEKYYKINDALYEFENNLYYECSNCKEITKDISNNKGCTHNNHSYRAKRQCTKCGKIVDSECMHKTGKFETAQRTCSKCRGSKKMDKLIHYEGHFDKCTRCGGNKTVNEALYNNCKKCGGTGEFKIGSKYVGCLYCGGDGKPTRDYELYGDKKYDGKKGTGKVVDTTSLEKCSTCGGDGKLSSGRSCSICGGDGYKDAIVSKLKCTFCNGSGKIKKQCPACFGEGIDMDNGLECQVCDGKKYVEYDCEYCGGAGSHTHITPTGKTCPQCKGTGNGLWHDAYDKMERVDCDRCGATGKENYQKEVEENFATKIIYECIHCKQLSQTGDETNGCQHHFMKIGYKYIKKFGTGNDFEFSTRLNTDKGYYWNNTFKAVKVGTKYEKNGFQYEIILIRNGLAYAIKVEESKA